MNILFASSEVAPFICQSLQWMTSGEKPRWPGDSMTAREKKANRKLRGILNGIDVGRYDPWRDQRLPRLFNARQLKGKKDCKAALQALAGLTMDPNVPVIGCVSRLHSRQRRCRLSSG